MIDIPDEKLKLSIGFPRVKSGKVELLIPEVVQEHSLTALSKIKNLQEQNSKNFLMEKIFHGLREQVIDRIWGMSDSDLESDKSLMSLFGQNNSKLYCEVFVPADVLVCEEDVFIRRTKFKVKRTILNLKELQKAYPDDYQLPDLEEKLENLDLSSSAGVLRQKIIALMRTTPYHTYLQLKQKYIEDWLKNREKKVGKCIFTPMEDHEFQETMSILAEHNKSLTEDSDVIRYKDHQFFRPFNMFSHKEVQSDSLDFWKTEANRNSFQEFVQLLWEKFAPPLPFYVFRFESSFVYFLCGIADDSLTGSIISKSKTAPIHAKIIMRQTNQAYRELNSENNFSELYYDCLKTAMSPFIEKLNERLEFGLSKKFLSFFKV